MRARRGSSRALKGGCDRLIFLKNRPKNDAQPRAQRRGPLRVRESEELHSVALRGSDGVGCDRGALELVSVAGFFFSQGVGAELEDLNAEPVVDCLQRFHDRVEFVDREYPGRFHNVAQPAGIVWHDAH